MTDKQRSAYALGLLHAASEIVMSAVTATRDETGADDPDVWDVNLALVKVVSKYCTIVDEEDRHGT